MGSNSESSRVGGHSIIGVTTATRLKVAGIVFGLVMAVAAPAFGHASFSAAAAFNFLPNTMGGTGLVGSTPPYPPDTTVTVYTRVPYEQTELFNGSPDTTVDVKITVPAGWTNPACGAAKTNRNDVTTNNTNQPGTVVPGWTCVLETSGANTVLHWSGPQILSPGTPADSAQWFEFTVTTPSPAVQTTYNGTNGTEGFIVVQTYASAESVRWIPNAAVPGGGIVAGGLARTVAGPTCDGRPVTILGTPRNDKLFGTSGDDVIMGLAGEDSLYGLGGNDVICGGGGNDVVDGGAGNDTVDGEAGKDRLIGGLGDDTVRGADADDSLFGGPGNDTLDGGAARDNCNGGTGTNTFGACEIFPAGMG